MRIDLHTHSSASDGTDPPAVVMRRAAEAGLDVVALTDHDTLAGHEQARAALPPGLELVAGMELSCRLAGHSVHMLCYGVDPGNAELASQCEAIRTDRLRRAQAMVGKLRDLGVGITWEQVKALAAGGVVGRPHIAQAMVSAGAIGEAADAFSEEWIGPGGPAYVSRYALDPVVAIGLVRAAGGVVGRPHIAQAMVSAGAIGEAADAFSEEWIGPGGPAYVSRYALDPVVAIGLVRAAGGATVLAHPGTVKRGWQIPAEVIATLARAGLAGLEISHPDHDDSGRRRLARLAGELDLVPTGGSDDHGGLTGYRIGCEVTDPGAYQRLMARRGAGPGTGGG